MIEKERIKKLNSNDFQKQKFILYWMQASQRTEFNHAFEYAKHLANKYEKPLVVFFGITDSFPEANLRHYKFMLEGLKEVKEQLEKQNISFICQKISPEKGVVRLSKDACLVVTDRGYLKIQRKWRNYVAKKINSALIQVESDVVVPVETASIKEEYAAATIRPKINKNLMKYLVPLDSIEKINNSKLFSYETIDLSNTKKILSELNLDNSVKPVDSFHGGTAEAKKQLQIFIKDKLNRYDSDSNDPSLDCVSGMSPYLHFGQISPIYIALQLQKFPGKNADSYLEELIVRRELSMNFVFYNSNYDSFNSIPSWANETLLKHSIDKREYICSKSEFEYAKTHDSYWNAAQKQMLKEGKMHGYMRMYWAKKIIEWTKDPVDAYKLALYLNNKYELDGRDPNAYTGVAWCFGKHDHPWKERAIFGKVRYMNDKGLKRKFDIETYAKLYN
jgi:deoxyribodipyrimidine photo-lyase